MYRDEVGNFLLEKKGKVVYIASSNRNLEIYYENVKNLGMENIVKVDDLLEEDDFYRINYKLLDTLDKKEFLILISVEGLLKKYSKEKSILELRLGKNLPMKEIEKILLESGYSKNYMVEKRMEFSIRGDIMDIFPPSGDNPVRLEFFGDEIDRMGYFSLDTQKTVEKSDSLHMYINKNNKNSMDFFQLLYSYKQKYKIFVENIELIKYKMETGILREREREGEIKELFSKVENEGKHLEVIKSETSRSPMKKDFSKEGVKYEKLSQILEGDYIIHEKYGVGIYLGIEKIDNGEYLKIKYADEDKLFVPIEGLNRIERYVCEPGITPSIYNLGTRGFKRRREKLEKEMLEFAKEIIEVQARRKTVMGYAFGKDTIWQEEFEEKFPYRETRDQRTAIHMVKRDMESPKVMDRIVCGDVGYGKTEVAIRATFKSVMDGKQVLIMAPTTVLAQQHYERFKKRFEDYPITMELLSRIKNDREQEEVLKGLKSGSIDVVIGTHRLLSEDVKFNDLGLIVLDEEQKFGVKAKEKLKKIRDRVDILTLTATPIPRTLNLALLGIRDISIIETAPEGRIPVETQFIERDKKVIREKILEEVGREGQIFYIYNVVKNMEEKVEELRGLLPKYISVDYIHGKMSAQRIKKVLDDFEDGEIDILVASTIIENGIDIENANSIFIEGIDKLGLSQVYQLRGRVGRGKVKGYCYIILDEEKSKGKKVKMREESLKELSENGGGGFQLSLEDMKIRGAGEILGEKQHGALEIFGYNLYMKLLQEEIKKVAGEVKVERELRVDLDEEAYIPDDYIEKDEKLIIYRRAMDMDEVKDIKNLELELRDRFGEVPEPVKNLFRYLRVKILGKEALTEIIEKRENKYFIKFYNESVKFEKLYSMIELGEIKYSKKENGIYLEKRDIEEFLYEYLK
ncbi:transcription-repair coupling factor (superfamily II helicase) [Cetobacterium ceti]|uniref:Transcription-repair-coupling factor n=1 Tax=Cetobacterium ceti TaxID=180163 RepID=A0A1T4PJA9_9FUSO|nr:DEAD/DEAH box helicase [Cetobacterium ceti]SJZ91633.1 transcription-repair coupling factor (superfamily II helicase) [Cetobacterium ceti]